MVMRPTPWPGRLGVIGKKADDGGESKIKIKSKSEREMGEDLVFSHA